MKPHRKNEAARTRLKETGVPVRQCAVTRERLAQTDLVRFVTGPDGIVVPDIAAKLPGRGVWIRAERNVVDEGVKAGVFARGLKQNAKAPDNLSDFVESRLLDRCKGLLGMARKSGQIILGFDQVRAFLRKDEPGWMLEAADGSKDGRNKLHFLAKALYDDVRTAGALTAAELGMAFGRSHVIHGVLQKGPLVNHWAVAYGRLAGFRPAPEAHWFTREGR